MHRKVVSLVIAGMLLTVLAACGNNAPAATPIAQQNSAATTAPVEQPTTIPPTAESRVYATGQPTIPPPGTLIAAATEDPDKGTPYDTVSLYRTGGIAGKPLEVVVLKDGTLTRDGVAGATTPDVIKQITDLLDGMGFIDMNGVFEGVGTSPDVYTYRISVERNGSSRSITAQDGFLPDPLKNLISLLLTLGTAQ